MVTQGGNPFLTTLGGVQVIMNNRPAALYFVSPGQIAAIVPYGITESVIQVQVVRNGLRAIAYGDGATLDLRFMAANADIQNGDTLVTSGIDGIYTPGLPVAEVTAIEPNPLATFSRVACKPLGGVSNNTRVFVVQGSDALPPRPPEDSEQAPRGRKGRKGG